MKYRSGVGRTRNQGSRFGHEKLEDRLPLTADLAFTGALADVSIVESETFDVSFQFTDSATVSSGSSLGFNPADYASLGVFDPAATTTSIVFDTDALTVTGFAGLGVLDSQDAGNGAYDVAVFTFDSFDLDSGQTITATGSRPLVLLSQSDLTIGGVIDVSASGQLAGVGGGNGGTTSTNVFSPTTAGSNAAGAIDGAGPSVVQLNLNGYRAGGGGGFGGTGGGGVGVSGAFAGGSVNGDLQTALQGGGGGGAGSWRPSSLLTYQGGGGGGAVELGATGAVEIEATGQVLADGADGQAVAGVVYSGAGGAGGGIRIHAFDVTVAGELSAQGGDASAVSDKSHSGAGSGGRILIAHDQSGLYDVSSATINVAGGLAGGGTTAIAASASGQDGSAGDFSSIATQSTSTVDSYTYAIDLLDQGGTLLETLVAPTAVTNLTLSTAGDEVTGSVALTGLDSVLGLLADDADLQVRVTVSDSQAVANVATDVFALTVLNDNPDNVAATSTALISENGMATLDVSFADAGVLDQHTVTINWGDGTVNAYTLNVGDRAGQFTHTYLDDGASGVDTFAYSIAVSVNDDDNGGNSTSTSTTVENLAPTILSLSTDSPSIGGAQQGDTVNLVASFADVGTLDTHSAVIDWGDDTTTTATVDQLASTLEGSHVYTQGGFYDVTVTLTDDDTGQAVSATQTVIAGVGVHSGVLTGVGTNGDDVFKVFRHWFSSDLLVLSRLDSGGYDWQTIAGPVDGIDLHLGAGNDVGFVSQAVSVDAYLDGGSGDDLLAGGSGNDILLGGAGFDILYGGHGRDLMIGGTGSDLIYGESGSDLLIAGTTTHDSNRAALDLIMAEWTSSRSYSERVDNLTGDLDLSADGLNDQVFLLADGPDATVFDDESVDWLIGGRGKDLYFSGDQDITFARFSEVVEAIEAEAPSA